MATVCLAVASCSTCAPLNPEDKHEEFEYFLPAVNAKLLLVQADLASSARDAAETERTRRSDVARTARRVSSPVARISLSMVGTP